MPPRISPQEQLYEAAKKGDAETIARLLSSKKANRAYAADDCSVVLNYAVRSGCYESVRLVLEDGADTEDEGCDALPYACAKENVAMVDLLLYHSCQASLRMSGINWWCFVSAAKKGREEILNRLMQEKDFSHPLIYSAALVEAAKYGHTSCVALMLKAGADAAHQNSAALSYAVGRKNHEMASLLLKADADPNARKGGRPGGKNALTVAVHNNDAPMLDILLHYGADAKDSSSSALLLACSAHQEELIDRLFSLSDTRLVSNALSRANATEAKDVLQLRIDAALSKAILQKEVRGNVIECQVVEKEKIGQKHGVERKNAENHKNKRI